MGAGGGSGSLCAFGRVLKGEIEFGPSAFIGKVFGAVSEQSAKAPQKNLN
jgi:hypothetical protein